MCVIIAPISVYRMKVLRKRYAQYKISDVMVQGHGRTLHLNVIILIDRPL